MTTNEQIELAAYRVHEEYSSPLSGQAWQDRQERLFYAIAMGIQLGVVEPTEEGRKLAEKMPVGSVFKRVALAQT